MLDGQSWTGEGPFNKRKAVREGRCQKNNERNIRLEKQLRGKHEEMEI